MYGSSYGSGMYGNSYGGGMYGSGAYGNRYGMYGGGGYGSSMYGANGQKPMGAPFTNALVHNGQSFIDGVHQHVSMFGRFSQILHMNFEVCFFIRKLVLVSPNPNLLSIIRLCTCHFHPFFNCYRMHPCFDKSLVRSSQLSVGFELDLYYIYVKARNIVLRALGRHADAERHELGSAWDSSTESSSWGWLPMLLTVSFVVWILRKLYQMSVSTSRSMPHPHHQGLRPNPVPSSFNSSQIPAMARGPLPNPGNMNSFPSAPYQAPFGQGDGFADYWGD